MASNNNILRLILGDQLNTKHSWFKEVNPNVTYCLFESKSELEYTTHHIQKIVGFFLAMRDFENTLKSLGHNVIYLKINAPDNKHCFEKNITKIIDKCGVSRFEYLAPDEFRLDKSLKNFCKTLQIESECFSTEHFYTNRLELKSFFEGKKTYLMESFYRMMRKKHDVLMVGKTPLGGKWNYDKNNRNKWSEKNALPNELNFQNEYYSVLEDLNAIDYNSIGKLEDKYFSYPINYAQSKELLNFFCEHLLIYFGTFQDAMHTDQRFLFHSKLSFALNLKIITPKEVVDTVVEYALEHDEIDISQTEGFVRQILGWREYMRGMYWALMPNYKTLNHLENNNKLPNFFWTGNTKMKCLKHAINQSLETSYAHHIQRLMVTGNFALLMGVNPNEVDNWYLGIYLDAVEWVQLPNTRGMSQYADGGLIATKPYISSASYINKMSNYCKGCYYNFKERTTEKACPFNSLYWNFLIENQNKLVNNQRMKMMYALVNKMNPEERLDIVNKANQIKETINDY